MEVSVEVNDGGEVHGGDVVGGAGEVVLRDEAVGALRGVEGVPEGEHLPVGAHVGRRRAQPDPVVRALPTARDLGRREPCNRSCIAPQAYTVIFFPSLICMPA